MIRPHLQFFMLVTQLRWSPHQSYQKIGEYTFSMKGNIVRESIIVGFKQTEFYVEEREESKREKQAFRLPPAQAGVLISARGPVCTHPLACSQQRAHKQARGSTRSRVAACVISPALRQTYVVANTKQLHHTTSNQRDQNR